jgi:hypothetical protein
MRMLIVLLGLMLCACGDGGRQPDSHDRIFDTQRSALDKAQGVGDKVMDSAQQQRSQEQEQTK